MKRRRLLFLSVFVVALLVGGCGLSVWQAKRQYACNRQLIAALLRNDSKQAIALVNAGADPNTRYDPTPAPTLERLLNQLLRRSPAPVNESPTAFLLACGSRFPSDEGVSLVDPEDVTLVQVMLAHGADSNLTDTNKRTALLAAILCDYDQVAKLLVEHGAKVNTKSDHDMSPIMVAMQESNTSMVRLLLEHGLNVDLEDENGETALHYAIWWSQNQEIIRLLLAHGADPNHADHGGTTPLLLAQHNCKDDFVALLRKNAK